MLEADLKGPPYVLKAYVLKADLKGPPYVL
jgi:hypothetical protein